MVASANGRLGTRLVGACTQHQQHIDAQPQVGTMMADFNFSIFTRSPVNNTDDTTLTDVLQQALDALPGSAGWESNRNSMWCYVSPAGSVPRPQGWKLHVSATPASAKKVLARSLPVLLGSG